MDNKPTTSEIIIMASGAVAFIFSFFDWFEAGDILSINGWDTDFTFPLGTYVPIIGVIMAGQVALSRFAGTKFPEPVLSFTWRQIHLALAVFATLIMIGFLIVSPSGLDKSFGLWLCLLAAIGLLVGAIMMQSEPDTATTRPGTAPPTPF